MEPFVWRVRVYYEDTDLSGVVYHANYLRWFERGRTEWLRALGYSQQTLLRDSGFAFTVARMELRFHKPARLDDEVDVVTSVCELGRVTLTFAQRLVRSDDQTLLCEASVKVACIDTRTFRPRAIPAELLQGEKA